MAFVFTASGAQWQATDSAVAVRGKASTTPYGGSSQGRRAVNWTSTRSGPKTVQYGNLEVLRDRAHDAIRNNPYAKNSKNTWKAEAIGTGIKPQSLHKSKKIRTKIEDAFSAWCEESEINQRESWYGQQSTGFGTIFESGEIFGRFVLNNRKDTFLPLTFQLLDPDQMPTWFTDASQGIRSGIQFNEDGRITNYHFFKEHPYDVMFFPNAWDKMSVPAADIVHSYQAERVGDIRGTPWLTSVIKRLHELERYDDAELARKASTAMAAGFIRKTSLNEDGPAGNEQPDLFSNAPANAGVANVQWEPGSISVLGPNEEMQFFTPPSDVSYDPYMTSQLHACAAGCDLSYHQFANDLRKANYSSLRAGLVSFRRKCEQMQYLMFVYQFCRPVWRRVIKEAVLRGKLDLPGFEKNPYPYYDCEWITPGWDWVDPLKDVQATVASIQAGLTSRKAAVLASGGSGGDVEQVDRDNKADNDRAIAMGLAYNTVAAEVLGRGESPGVDEAADQEPDDAETKDKKDENA